MKRILIASILLFLSTCCFCQKYIECTKKVNEWGMWEEVNTTIIVDKDKITLIEVEGIEISVKYDLVTTNADNIKYYTYNGAVRVSINQPIVVFMATNYFCPTKG